MKTALIAITALALVLILASSCTDTGACVHAAVPGVPESCMNLPQQRCEAHTSSQIPPMYLGGSCESHGFKHPCISKSYLKCK
ncbi:MAG: hypothetical protein H0T76_24870 [Nannocystis sp.]|nr:hypothetical protein [Nannocystis sp.]MBA3549725.1 hypothetical protein [Nannocystis sp.]